MLGHSSLSERTRQMCHEALILTNGLLGDSDFDIEEHKIIVEVCGFNPQNKEDISAIDSTCMGHKIPREIYLKIKERHDQLSQDI